MKLIQIIFTIYLAITTSNIFGQDWVEFRDLREKEEGYVIENSGYTTNGIIQIKPCNEKTIVNTKDSIIKIDPLLIKEIHKGTHTYIPKFFNDSSDFYFCEVLDTLHKLKFYKGYYCDYSGAGGFIAAMSPTFWHAYILTTDNNEALAFDRSKGNVGPINYKKQLKYAFANNHKISQYLDSWSKIKFEDIPKVVEYINSLY